MMGLLDEISSVCKFCNLETCKCLASTEKKKVYSSVTETYIKKKKWITRVVSNATKEDFSAIKQKLGTGGTYHKDHLDLRGRIKSRVIPLLEKMNFKFQQLGENLDSFI